MRLIHTSDLHLGIRLGEYRLFDEQARMLDWLRETAETYGADGLLIAGDIFDRSAPSVETVALFDRFLTEMTRVHIPLFAIAGNHDAAERIAYGREVFAGHGIHLSAAFDGITRCACLEKNGQRVYIHLLPFVRPTQVRLAYGTEENQGMSWTDAVDAALRHIDPARDGRHVLLCHQFFTGGIRSESEERPTVGGLDEVNVGRLAESLSSFDYTAAGHLHRAQCVTPVLRYAGSPLPYAFSETEEKGVWLVDLAENGETVCTFLPTPRDICPLTTWETDFCTLMSPEFYENTGHRTDYLRLILTDDTEVPDAMARLTAIYPRIVSLTYRIHMSLPHRPDPDSGEIQALSGGDHLSPLDVFASFYERQHGEEMCGEDRQYLQEVWENFSCKEEI